MTRTKKAIKNSIFSILQQFVNIITNIVLPPIIIATFGSTINGLIATIKQIMGYIQLVGAGISTSTIESLYKPLAEKDEKKINGYINATNNAFNVAGNLFYLIVIIISFIYPLFLVRTDINYFTVVLLVLIMGITGASEFFVIGKYRTLLIADQKMFIVSLTQIVGNISNVIVTVILIYLKQNILIVELFATIVYILRTMILIIYIRKNYRYLDKRVPPVREATSKRKYALFHQLAGTVVSGSTVILVSIFCGLKESSIYSVYALIFIGISSVCDIFSNTLVPSFGELVAENDRETLKKVYGLYESIYFIYIFIFYSVALVTVLPFISIYTIGADINYINPILAVLFVIFGIGTNLKVPSSTMIVSHGHFKETKYLAIIEIIINLLGQFTFVVIWGLNGILIGSICSLLYRTISTIRYTNKNILKISNRITIKRLLVNFIATFIPAYIFSCLFNFNSNGYIEWFIKAGSLTVVISIISLMLNYIIDKETMRDIIFRIKSLIRI